MATGNFTIYDAAKQAVLEAEINLATDKFFAVLVTSAYTPNVGSDATYANVSGSEASGTGYTAGGLALGSLTLTKSGDAYNWNTAAIEWDSSSITAKYVVIVRAAGATLASTDKLLGYADLNVGAGASITSNSGTFKVTPNASGWFGLA